MAKTLYHREVFLPKELELEALTLLVCRGGKYELTRHAVQRARQKRVKLPPQIPYREAKVVEVTTFEGRMLKFLIRFPHCEEADVCMSVTAEGRVPTVYLNNKDDHHATLRKDVYAQASAGLSP